jgi:hypothetical protein
MNIKHIPGYENYYAIDEYGTVYSLQREIMTVSGEIVVVPGKIISPYYNKHGYAIVKLNRDNKRSSHLVSTLLKRTFE